MSKGPNGQKRSTCPAGCKAADPMQTVFPVNQLADAGATGSWLRLIASGAPTVATSIPATVPQGRSGDGTTA